MKRETLLFIAYHQNKESVSEDIVDRLEDLLIDTRVVRVIIDVTDYENACKSIDNVLEQEYPDVIFAEGAACFYAHQLVGYNRICLNPQFMISSLVSPSEVEKYKKLESRQFSYDRDIDIENNTFCFGLFTDTCDEESKRQFLMMYYPNVDFVDDSDTTYSIKDAIKVLVKIIKCSDWLEEGKKGVVFVNYGLTLTKASATFCKKVEDYDIPTGVCLIGEEAFYGMEDLKRVTFPSTLKHLGASAFKGCIQLKEIELPPVVNEIPAQCFYGCRSLEKVKLPDTIYAIKEKAFAGTSLKEVELPDSVRYISPNAFEPDVRISVSASRITRLLKAYQLMIFTKKHF